MGLMSSMRSCCRKKNGWNVPVDLSRQNYCVHNEAVISICICRFCRWVFWPNSAKCSVVKQAGGRQWGMESESLNQSCRGGGLRRAPYLPFLIILYNLQFKEKKSSFKLFIYLFSIKEVKSIFFFSCSFLENPLVDCSECCHSASVQTERFWNAHRRVGNNGDANEKTFHTPQRLRGQWRGR